MMRSRRTAVAFLALLVFAGFAPARAANPDPTGAIQDLIPVSNVVATGFGPKTIVVSWDNEGQCAGFQLPCVTVSNKFNIQASLDEAGPYKTVTTYANACLRCVTTVTNERLGLTPADPRPVFIRVVPVISTPPIDANNSHLADPVDLFAGRPSAPDPAVLGPLPPTDVMCNGGSSLECVNVNNVTLTWTDNSDEKQFWIMRAKGATNPNFGTTPHATVGEDVSTFSETLDEFNTVYQYRIVAVRVTQVLRLDGPPTSESSYSNCDAGDQKTACTVTAQSAPIPSPSTPSALNAAFSAPSTATLTWVDKELNPDKHYIDEDGWFIEQTPDFLANGQPNWQSKNASQVTRSPGDPGTGVRTYVDDNFPLDTTRCYRVRGWRAGPAYSDYTNVSCIGSTPKAPTNLIATATTNATVNLSWTDNSSSETSDLIQRCDGICTSTSSWQQVGSAPTNTTTFNDTTTSGLHTYSYRVFAVNPSGPSPSSNIALATTPPAPIATPQNLQAAGMQHAIRLDWQDVSGETGYEIDYRSPGGTFAFLTSVGADVTTYVDSTSLGVNQTRCYQVRALDGANKESDPSNEACATTLPSMPPAAPSNLSVVDPSGIGNTSIELSWLDNANNETGFVVEYIAFPNTECSSNPDVVDSTFFKWGTAPALSGSGVAGNFTVTGLVPHSAYFFRVKATNQDGDSAYANAVSPYRADYPSTTACAQTAGPLRPVWTDPSQNGDAQATRCDVTLQASDDHSDPGRVGGIRLYVNAYVPGSSLGNTDTIYVGKVPGISPDQEDDPIITSGAGTKEAQWQIKYHFRHGFNYRLLATTYTADANQWSSATGIISDMTVYADCPLQ